MPHEEVREVGALERDCVFVFEETILVFDEGCIIFEKTFVVRFCELMQPHHITLVAEIKTLLFTGFERDAAFRTIQGSYHFELLLFPFNNSSFSVFIDCDKVLWEVLALEAHFLALAHSVPYIYLNFN